MAGIAFSRWAPWTAALGLVCAAGATTVIGRAASLPLAGTSMTDYRTCLLTATPSTTPVVADTYAAQDSAGTNFGSSASLDVRSYNSSRNRRTYVRFDVTACSPQIAATTSVKTATLRLSVATLPSACRTYDVFRVQASWTESGLTWTNQPFGTGLNNPPSAQRTASTAIGPAPCTNSTAFTYASWNVTTDVQAWVSGSATNHGWMIRDDAENSSQQRLMNLTARNAGQLTRAPQLSITYFFA